jgi:hypothetical protein
MSKFHTSKGWLTPYALACGYVEKRHKGGMSITLWQEHGVYHVRAHSHSLHKRILWQSMPKISDARRLYWGLSRMMDDE